jgi:hypothetical protein
MAERGIDDYLCQCNDEHGTINAADHPIPNLIFVPIVRELGAVDSINPIGIT